MYLDSQNIKVLNKKFQGETMTNKEKKMYVRTQRVIQKYDKIHEQNQKVNIDDIFD